MIFTFAGHCGITVYTDSIDETFVRDLLDKCDDCGLQDNSLVKIGICKGQFGWDTIKISPLETVFMVDHLKSVIKYPSTSPLIHIPFMVNIYNILERN